MEPQKLLIKVNERESVTALLYRASKKIAANVTLVLGHGAGANQLSPFMRLFGSGLAARGLDALTFNFLYTEQGRRVPDPKARLEACYGAVVETALSEKTLKNNRLIVGGKSMGGRIASQIAAVDCDNIAGLVFLGYPLHPPGKPEQLRDAHLRDVKRPMLFVQGSRDAFGSEEEIRAVIKKRGLKATLYVIPGGDHSLKVPKSATAGQKAVSQQEVYETVMDEVARWAKESTSS